MKLRTLKPNLATLDTRQGSKLVERVRGRRLQESNRRILMRDNWTCRICGICKADEIDHIVPLVDGGGDNDENLQAICRGCHRTKSDIENKKRNAP